MLATELGEVPRHVAPGLWAAEISGEAQARRRVEGLARQRVRSRDSDRMFAGMLGRGDAGPDPLLAKLHARRDRMSGLHLRLRADAVVHLVVVPEPVVWAETVRALDVLEGAGIAIGAAVVNRVVPAGETGLLAARRGAQAAVLDAVRARFAATVEIPLLPEGPTGLAALGTVLDLLAAADR